MKRDRKQLQFGGGLENGQEEEGKGEEDLDVEAEGEEGEGM